MKSSEVVIMYYLISGLPNIAIWKKLPAQQSKSESNITLVWQVDSYSPIIEYRLLFRQHLVSRRTIIRQYITCQNKRFKNLSKHLQRDYEGENTR